MSEALRRLLEQPAALSEQQVNELRVMVAEAKRVLDRQREDEHFIHTIQQEQNVIFETADGLKAFDYREVSRGAGLIYVLKRPVRKLDASIAGKNPKRVGFGIPFRTYEFSRFVGGRTTGRIPVYKEVVK